MTQPVLHTEQHHTRAHAFRITDTRHSKSFGSLATHLRLGLLVVMLLLGSAVHGLSQTISANLSGFVSDPTGAVIPNAQVTLTNTASKDKRTTKSNSAGYFNFTAVPAATYQVEVKSPGFESFVERGIILHPADDRTLTDIKLLVGAVDTTVTIDSAASAILNQGEKSVVITAEDIKRLPVQGRDVTELIKTLPGFAMTAQSGADNTGPNTTTVGGQTQSYTANGVSSQGIQIISDGVNITDPGNGAGTDQAINMDNVAEVKIQTSNFGADSAKGPIVINAVGKSGGSSYHGELYVHGRTSQLNTQDWFSKYDNDAKPTDREIYPGGNIGGPVLIPGTSFNHSRKLTFFVGMEDYIQRNIYSYGSASAATVTALVPTANMRTGNFTAQELSNYFGPSAGPVVGGKLANCNANPTAYGSSASNTFGSQYLAICNVPSGTNPTGQGAIVNGNIPTAFFDPGTQAMLKLIPLPNTTPQSRDVGGIYNYRQVNLQNNDGFQGRARVDYAFSDSSKLYATYNYSQGKGHNPQQIFYSPQDSFGEINTPGGILSKGTSHVFSINDTTVITPNLTNELYVGVSLILSGNKPGIPGSNLSTYINYPYAGLCITAGSCFNTHGQYPQLYDYGSDGLPLALFPDYSSPIFQNKFVPSGGDNLTRVIKTHTVKVGFYIERTENNQTDLNGSSNGQLENYYDGPNNAPGNIQEHLQGGTTVNYNTPGNYLASFFMGQISAFQQESLQTNSNLYYWTVDGYMTDSWKVNKKLTLDYGFRLGHVGPWQDAHGLGMAVWSPSLYAAQTSVANGVVTATTVNPGYTWHAINNSVPNSGTGSTWAFFSPRFGLAYDVYGDGKTFVRGGIGAYRFHDGWNDVNQEQETSQGQQVAIAGGGGILLKDLPNIATTVSGGNANNGFGLSQGDTEQPLTYTYSFTVDQQINASTLFELSYQGNQTSHLLTQYEQGASGDLANINALPIGSLFKPDPLTGQVSDPSKISNDNRVDDYRPFPYYNQVNVARHILYSNYNGLQVSLRKTQGRFIYSFNYTWSKNLGILGSYGTGNVIDSTNIRPNYGPLASDRSHVTNDTISYQVGDWFHGNRIARGFLNGYEISGIMNLQSGPNIQRVLGSNLGLGGQVQNPTGTSASTANNYSISNLTFLGTPDVVLQPQLTCDPRSGFTKPHQYINGKCFAFPSYGVNGPAVFPYIHGPAYFDLDARLSKSFKLQGRKSFDLQLSAFNVINRPNYSFSSKFPLEQTLTYLVSPSGDISSPSAFGQALFRFGRRVTEISLKYNF
jgi:hypothetical protein